jgi:hypothetical protein
MGYLFALTLHMAVRATEDVNSGQVCVNKISHE